MTTDHTKQLADGDRLSKRASVFALLLDAVLERATFTYRTTTTPNGWQCPYCHEVTPITAKTRAETAHKDDCLYSLIVSALDADDAELDAIRAALTGEDA